MTRRKRRRTPAGETEHDRVFAALRALLEPYRGKLRMTERKGYVALDDHSVRGWSIGFAAVVAKRTAVSFYLMAQHYQDGVLDGASAGLLARRTKAKFFNFKELDAPHIAELGRLLARSYARWDPAAIARRR